MCIFDLTQICILIMYHILVYLISAIPVVLCCECQRFSCLELFVDVPTFLLERAHKFYYSEKMKCDTCDLSEVINLGSFLFWRL